MVIDKNALNDPMPIGDDYIDRQDAHDREYMRAWESSPPEFREAAANAGLAPAPEKRDGMAIEFNDNYASSSYSLDMSDALDDYVDTIIEKLGIQHAAMIRQVSEMLKIPMEIERDRDRALVIGRVVSYLISDERGNLLAKSHSLLHAVPKLAALNGYPSLRSSAKRCSVSAEWLRRTRDKVCDLLGLEIPAEGRKSEAAKEKYSNNAKTNHWRNKKFLAPKNHE